jgi:hypothetical protein
MSNIARLIRRTVLVLLALTLPWAAHAEGTQPELLLDRRPADGPTLLILGTAHFANPGKDLVKASMENVLTEKRQEQIVTVVSQLAAFRPTLIAVEWPQREQEKLNSVYGEYRARRQTLNVSEQQQIGFRLADRLNLTRVHAIDWNGMPPGDLQVYNYPKWAEAHGQTATLQAIVERSTATSVRLGPDETMSEWLIRMNRPQALLENHRVYFDIARLGDGEAQPGAAWVGTWYARNLRIFTNLTRLTSDPQERILVVYGAGHAHLLRQFATESNAFRLVDVGTVLKGR